MSAENVIRTSSISGETGDIDKQYTVNPVGPQVVAEFPLVLKNRVKTDIGLVVNYNDTLVTRQAHIISLYDYTLIQQFLDATGFKEHHTDSMPEFDMLSTPLSIVDMFLFITYAKKVPSKIITAGDADNYTQFGEPHVVDNYYIVDITAKQWHDLIKLVDYVNVGVIPDIFTRIKISRRANLHDVIELIDDCPEMTSDLPMYMKLNGRLFLPGSAPWNARVSPTIPLRFWSKAKFDIWVKHVKASKNVHPDIVVLAQQVYLGANYDRDHAEHARILAVIRQLNYDAYSADRINRLIYFCESQVIDTHRVKNPDAATTTADERKVMILASMAESLKVVVDKALKSATAPAATFVDDDSSSDELEIADDECDVECSDDNADKATGKRKADGDSPPAKQRRLLCDTYDRPEFVVPANFDYLAEARMVNGEVIKTMKDTRSGRPDLIMTDDEFRVILAEIIRKSTPRNRVHNLSDLTRARGKVSTAPCIFENIAWTIDAFNNSVFAVIAAGNFNPPAQ